MATSLDYVAQASTLKSVIPQEAHEFASVIIRLAERRISQSQLSTWEIIQSVLGGHTATVSNENLCSSVILSDPSTKELSLRNSNLPGDLQAIIYGYSAIGDSLDDWFELTGFFLSTPKDIETIRAIIQSLKGRLDAFQLKEMKDEFSELEALCAAVEKEVQTASTQDKASQRMIHFEHALGAMRLCLDRFLDKVFQQAFLQTSRESLSIAIDHYSSFSMPMSNSLKLRIWLTSNPKTGMLLILIGLSTLYFYLIPKISLVVFGPIFKTVITSVATFFAQAKTPAIVAQVASKVCSAFSFAIEYPYLYLPIKFVQNSILFSSLLKRHPTVKKVVNVAVFFLTYPAELTFKLLRVIWMQNKPSNLSIIKEFHAAFRALALNISFFGLDSTFSKAYGQWRVVCEIALDAMFKNASEKIEQEKLKASS